MYDVNLNHIKIFESVYRTKSMTRAADELQMTQSGVSQQIKQLEEIIGVKLFDRIKQRIVPTKEADFFFTKCKKGLDIIDQALNDLSHHPHQITGEISIGLPVEFGNNIILPLLARFGETHKNIRFHVKYGFASTIERQLLKGELDFAFIDGLKIDSQIKQINVYQEILVLCFHERFLKETPHELGSKNFFESLDYVDYMKEAPILKMWFKHNYSFNNLKLNIRSNLLDVQGLAILIKEGMGAGILPDHYLKKLNLGKQQIYQYTPPKSPLINSISLAYVRNKTRSQSTELLINFLKEKLSSGKY